MDQEIDKMKEKNQKIEQLKKTYREVKREMKNSSIYNLVISEGRKNVRYNPAYQRNYIWNDAKAINLIETIFLKGIIPPMTVIKHNEKLEIIDRKTEI